MDGRRQQARELRRQIEWTLARAMDPTDVLPMLHRLARLADDGSDESVYANLHLAELLVERDPWRAALCARRVLAQRPADDRVWATLALCQTLLGNYRFAVSAYHHALSSAPDNPWYAHNLGHLLDVALGRARDALPWLERAYRTAGSSGELSASYAHALARVGRLAQARRVLARAMRRTASREHTALLRWLEQGAPPDKDHPLPRPAPFHTMELTDRAGDERADAGRAGKVRRESADGPEGSPSAGASGPAVATVDDEARGREPRRSALLADLDEVLARGLASLPLDAKQRARQVAGPRRADPLHPSDREERDGGAVRGGGRGLRHRVRRSRAAHAVRGGGVLPRERGQPAWPLRRAPGAPRPHARGRPLRHAATAVIARGRLATARAMSVSRSRARRRDS